MLPQILGTFISVFILSGVFAFMGGQVFRRAYGKTLSPVLEWSLGYFTGLAAFLSLWRLLGLALGSASFSFFISLGLFLAALVFYSRTDFKKSFSSLMSKWTTILALLVSLAAVIVFSSALWLHSVPTESQPFENFGSAHSVRYTNIAEYVYNHNSIPVLEQNFGQSLLNAAIMFLGFHSSFLALNFWLSVSILFLALMAYGLFKHLGLERRQALWGAFIFMFGGTALSLTHVLSFDSNGPFAMSNYTDILCSVGGIVALLFVIHRVVLSGKLEKFVFLSLGIFAVYWNFSAPQNIFFILGLLGLLGAYYILKRQRVWKNFAAMFLGFLIFSAVGAFGGGMFSVALAPEAPVIPGVTSIERPGEYTGIKPELPFAVGWAYDWEYGNPYSPGDKALFVNLIKGAEGFSGETVYKALWRLESNFWTALRIMFFPLLGLVGYFFLRRKHPKHHLSAQEETGVLWGYSALIFILGFLPAFFIIIAGRKWEMSRFMVIPYALGLLFFVLFLYLWKENSASKKLGKFIFYAAVSLITAGPIVNAAGIIHRNFPEADTVRAKLSAYAQNPPIIGKEAWEKANQKKDYEQ